MKKLTVLAVALVALGLGSQAQARTGGWSGHVLYALESASSYDTSSTATCIKGYTFSKNSLSDGDIIVMDLMATTAVTSTPNLTISVKMGNTIMITSSTLAITAGFLKLRAVGQVRSLDSVSSGTRTAGTILWSLEVVADQSSDLVELFCDTTADSVQTNIPDQDLTFEFTWSASSSSNILLVEQFTISKF